jgi:UDP:flavonoid glycosyltransferase YjiC (YdhE family)
VTNFLLITIGSHGDVHPFVGLGIVLRARGHDVTLATNGHFEPLARSAGLSFVELGTDEEYRQKIKDPDLWHKTRAFKTVFDLATGLLEPTYEIIRERYAPGKTVVAASSLAMGARIAQEHLGVPTATVHLQPSVIRTVYDVPKLPGLVMPRWIPKWLKQMVWGAGDKFFVDPVAAPAINALRQKLGMPPVRSILGSWWHSPQLIIGMWPEWFGPAQPDWPPQLKLVGFPLYDESGINDLPAELDHWLSAGEPPIVFSTPSANVHAGDYFATSVQACALLKRRGLLLTRHTEQIPRDLPANVRHFDYAPFKALLPRAAALVHSGGVGTTAQALRAGTPQLIAPLSHDQFDNAYRVERLGVGREISRTFGLPRVTRLLDEMLRSSEMKATCAKIATHFTDSGLEAAANLLEGLLHLNAVPAATYPTAITSA